MEYLNVRCWSYNIAVWWIIDLMPRRNHPSETVRCIQPWPLRLADSSQTATMQLAIIQFVLLDDSFHRVGQSGIWKVYKQHKSSFPPSQQRPKIPKYLSIFGIPLYVHLTRFKFRPSTPSKMDNDAPASSTLSQFVRSWCLLLHCWSWYW